MCQGTDVGGLRAVACPGDDVWGEGGAETFPGDVPNIAKPNLT